MEDNKDHLGSSGGTAESLSEARKTLTGDRNQCPGCSEYFNSTFAFEKHRTGDFNKDRRCRTTDEMEAKGMAKNAAGFWISSAMPVDVARA
jgi:hypothetical protein